MFDVTFDCVLSLGCGCTIANQLLVNRIPVIPGPFNKIVSQDLGAITSHFPSRFRDVFRPENMIRLPHNNHSICYGYQDQTTKFRSVHDFLIGDEKYGLENVYQHFLGKTDIFFDVINQSRNVLFIRMIDNDQEINQLGTLDGVLFSMFGDRFRLLAVDWKSDVTEISFDDISDRIILAKIPSKCSHLLERWSWMGNDKSWKALLSKVHLTPRYDLDLIHLKKDKVFENINGRKLVVWGLGINGFRDLETYYLNEYFKDDFFMYDSAMDKICELNHINPDRIIWNRSELNLREHYVIVSAKKFYPDINTFLRDHGFLSPSDYLYWYCS